MKVPKARKLASGNWFIQLRLGGESIPITARTEKACLSEARIIKAEYLAGKRETALPSDITLRQAVDKYIESRSNTLSPSTIRGYRAIQRTRFKTTMGMRVKDIKDWQAVCNNEAALCSPKTLKNAWLFIVSVLSSTGHNAPHIKLPQVVIKERPYLEPEQIPIFIDALKGQPCEIPALLALHSLRRSEICALTWEHVDLKKRRILISGAMVQDEDANWVRKESNKNTSSRRYIPILIGRLFELLEQSPSKVGVLVAAPPNTIYEQIVRVCRANNLPPVGVHGLRHSFASLAYHLGVPEKVAMLIGGWSDYGTMRKIYTHLAQKDVDKYGFELVDFFKNANTNANK